MSKPSSPRLTGQRCWIWFTISTPHTKDNQALLHARFSLGEDALEPYKETLARWLWPDPFRNQEHVRVQGQTGHLSL